MISFYAAIVKSYAIYTAVMHIYRVFPHNNLRRYFMKKIKHRRLRGKKDKLTSVFNAQGLYTMILPDDDAADSSKS